MKNIYIYNTLSKKKEIFQPIEPYKVKMYVCGITPYDEPHLGHARCYIVFDVIRRYLEYNGYEVFYVQNFTDIDDKIISKSKQLNINFKELTQKYINIYFDYSNRLNIKPANSYPKVTEYITYIINFIEDLIKKGYAYSTSEGNVYYSIEKFSSYGKLSNRTTDKMLNGVRIESDENKKHKLDFALWKTSKNDEPYWDSPWGKGRPGWHIECSTMVLKEFKTDTIDIHGGGLDLVFPHHENEIAQSEALTGKEFVKYWIHNGFVRLNKEKMSKSTGNFFSLEEIFKKYNPVIIRFFLLTQHYRTPIDFDQEKIIQSKNALEELIDTYEFINFLIWKYGIKQNKEILTDILEKFEENLNDDFNTENGISVLFELKNLFYQKIKENNLDIVVKVKNVFNIILEQILGIKIPECIYENPSKITELIEKLENREKLRKNKIWNMADKIRNEIFNYGYLIEDTNFGPRLKRINII